MYEQSSALNSPNVKAIRTIQKPRDGKLVITVPEEFENDELEIIVLLLREPEAQPDDFLRERSAIIKRYQGSATYKDVDLGEDAVYNR